MWAGAAGTARVAAHARAGPRPRGVVERGAAGGAPGVRRRALRAARPRRQARGAAARTYPRATCHLTMY